MRFFSFPLLLVTLVLCVQNLDAQNLILNHDFTLLQGCLDRRLKSHLVLPPFSGSYQQSNEFIDQFTNWFSSPEKGYPNGSNRKAFSYVAHHRNCTYAPVDSIVGVPYGLRNCTQHMIHTYLRLLKEMAILAFDY